MEARESVTGPLMDRGTFRCPITGWDTPMLASVPAGRIPWPPEHARTMTHFVGVAVDDARVIAEPFVAEDFPGPGMVTVCMPVGEHGKLGYHFGFYGEFWPESHREAGRDGGFLYTGEGDEAVQADHATLPFSRGVPCRN